MKKIYYRSEYSDKQWKALVDKAAELGCQITYNKYGDRAEIDSTDRKTSRAVYKKHSLRRFRPHKC